LSCEAIFHSRLQTLQSLGLQALEVEVHFSSDLPVPDAGGRPEVSHIHAAEVLELIFFSPLSMRAGF